jgi:hypothetical protein
MLGGGRYACQAYDLDAVNIQSFIINQSLSQDERPRGAVGLNVDLTLKTLKPMARRVQYILVERHSVIVHSALLHRRSSQLFGCLAEGLYASMAVSCCRLRSTI